MNILTAADARQYLALNPRQSLIRIAATGVELAGRLAARQGQPLMAADYNATAAVLRAAVEYQDSRTDVVIAGLEMIRRGGGTLARRPDGHPGSIAYLVGYAHLRGAHAVQDDFDRYAAASDNPALVIYATDATVQA